MLATPYNPPFDNERLAKALVSAGRLAFGALLFSSPFALRWTFMERPVANIFSSYTDFTFYFSDFFLLFILGFWLLSLIVLRRPFRRGPWFLTWPIVGLVALSWVGVITGIDPALTLYHSIRFTLLLGLYFFLLNEEVKPIWVAIPFSLGVLVQTLVALAQFYLQHSVGLSALGELALNPSDSGTSILRVDDLRVLRAYGLTEHPNVLGGFIAVGLVFMLGYYLYKASPALRRYLLLLPLPLGGVGLFMTFSRAAALAFLAGAALLAFVVAWPPSTRRRRVLNITLAAGVMLATATLPIIANWNLIAQRVGQGNSFVDNSNEQRSLAERDALVASANRVFLRYEFLGVGNGALPLAMYKLDSQFQKEFYYQPAHFILLDAAAELGLLGGMFWLWLLVTPFLALWLRRREAASNPWLAATVAVLFVLGVIGLFDYYPWLGVPGRLWQWNAWGLFGAAFQANHVSRDVV